MNLKEKAATVSRVIRDGAATYTLYSPRQNGVVHLYHRRYVKPPVPIDLWSVAKGSVLLFSSCIRNTVAIKVPEGVLELFEISKI